MARSIRHSGRATSYKCFATRHDDSSFLNNDDEVEVFDEDDESVEEYADEETNAENDIDTEEDDDDRSYHASDSD